jgi:peptide deformylase
VAERAVVLYPGRVLKAPCGPAGSIGPAEERLAQDLVDTMYGQPGCVGVAAPQIGVATRAFALDVSVMRKPPPGNHGLLVLFDPELLVAARAASLCLISPAMSAVPLRLSCAAPLQTAPCA